MRMHFAERKYKDWTSFNKVHDFTVTKKVDHTEEIKSEAIRELVKLLKYNLEIEDTQLLKLEDTIHFLHQVESLVKTYEDALESIVKAPDNYSEKVWIFDGTKETTIVDYHGMFSIASVEKAKLLNKIKILRKKRQAVWDCLESLMDFFDEAEK